MGLLDRLRAWWRATFRAGATGDDASAADVAAYECAVCGTGVEGPDERCPLCRSSDVLPAGAASSSADSAEPSLGRTTHVERGDNEAVERLRELRAQGELLERHADRWRAVDDGFVVETADGERVVESRRGVAELLRKEGVE